MYLSRIALDINSRVTMAALASPNKMHGAVENCFVGDRQRRLWRVDWLRDRCYLLILSQQEPNMSTLAAQFNAAGPGETKSLDALLARIEPGLRCQFRLCANPSHSNSKENGGEAGRGKVFAHVTQARQKQWLSDRAPKHGFTLEDDAFDTVHSQWLTFVKGGTAAHKVSLLRVAYEGVLRVSDADAFRAALIGGIGREKAYGCGLMTVIPIGDGR